MHAGPASAQMQTYTYTGPAFSYSDCKSSFSTYTLSCLNSGNVTASVTFNGVPAAYTGTIVNSALISSWSTNAGGIGSLNSKDNYLYYSYFMMKNGQIVEWELDTQKFQIKPRHRLKCVYLHAKLWRIRYR